MRNTRWYGGIFERMAYSEDFSLQSRVWRALVNYPIDIDFATPGDRSVVLHEELNDMLSGDVPMFEVEIFSGCA